jgi:Glycosyl transferases group 1
LRLHLVGLAHAHVSRDVTVCAFTTKTAKFLKMMSARGWDITLYGGDESVVPDGVELVPTFTTEDLKVWFGDMDANELPIKAGAWNSTSAEYVVTNHNVIRELGERYNADEDLVLLTGGLAQQPITGRMTELLACEWAAGYSGWYLPYVCFESYAWRHHCYGVQGIHDGRWFDTVIPNFFDPDEWELAPEKEDYLLYVGRMISRKGIRTAFDIANEMGKTIVYAGSGVRFATEGYIECLDGTKIEGDVIYVGTVGWEERKKLMGAARALIAPTTYIEPFGAVVVESMLAGTPSIATDWGAFTEILPPERRFSTLAEGCEAVELAMNLPPAGLREEALERYSLDAIAPRYERWFEQIDSLRAGGWYQMSPRAEKMIA